MRYIIGFCFLFLGFVGFAQVERTAGIAIGTTVPTHTPSTQGALKYYNRSSGLSYRWSGSAWVSESVNLSGYLQWSDTATLATKHYVDSQGFLTAEVDGSITNEIQQLDTFSLSGTTISASLSSDGVPAKTLDLSGIGLISSGVAGYLVQYTGATSQDTIGAFWDATTGRLGIGIASSLLARVHIKGPGTTSSTTPLLVENSAGTDIISANDAGGILLQGTITAGLGGGAITSNAAFGANALRDNTTGVDNTALGANALVLNTTGFGNTAFGLQALSSNTTGMRNQGIGRDALRGNTNGYDNCAIGYDAMFAGTSHSYNTAIGASAFRSNVTGERNTAIGGDAGRYVTAYAANTRSDYSIFIGFRAAALAINQTNQIVIGTDVFGLGSNTTRIGNSSTTRTHLDGTVTVGTASNNVGWYTGTGSPESVVTAKVGCIYTDIAGGAGTTLYVKESGTGNTGWIAK